MICSKVQHQPQPLCSPAENPVRCSINLSLITQFNTALCPNVSLATPVHCAYRPIRQHLTTGYTHRALALFLSHSHRSLTSPTENRLHFVVFIIVIWAFNNPPRVRICHFFPPHETTSQNGRRRLGNRYHGRHLRRRSLCRLDLLQPVARPEAWSMCIISLSPSPRCVSALLSLERFELTITISLSTASSTSFHLLPTFSQ